MDLEIAANYFADTLVDGWTGLAWDAEVLPVTLLPFDRFISERDFGNKRRHILVSPNTLPTLLAYPVIRFNQSGDVYMAGSVNSDIQGDSYSSVVLLHRAGGQGQVYGFTSVTSASGMASSVSRNQVGQYWCDVERVTLSNSREFDGVSFTQVTITLPSNAVIDTDNEMLFEGEYLDIREVFKASGFIQCRALSKRSS